MYTIVPIEAMVLQVLERDDSSAVAVVFSRELGKLYVHAQGIRKLAAKHAANVQVGAVVELDIVRGKHEWRLVGSRMITPSRLHEAGERMRFGKLAQVVLDLTAIEDPSEVVYETLARGAQESEASGTAREAAELARIIEALGWWIDDTRVDDYLAGKATLRDFVQAVNKGLTEAYA